MKLTFNAPVSLTMTIIAAVVLSFDTFFGTALVHNFFSAPPEFQADNTLDYIRIFSSTFGHRGWQHFVVNFSIILLIGPILEKHHGSAKIFIFTLVTILISWVISTFVIGSTLIGANAVTIMMLVLTSISHARKGELPISFLLVALILIIGEISAIIYDGSSTQLAQLIGGVCGGLLFLTPRA